MSIALHDAWCSPSVHLSLSYARESVWRTAGHNRSVAQVFLDGTTSHTHDAGRSLVSRIWQDVSSGAVVSKEATARCFYPFGEYTLALTIVDDAMQSLATCRTVVVAPDHRVPGAHTQLEC